MQEQTDPHSIDQCRQIKLPAIASPHIFALGRGEKSLAKIEIDLWNTGKEANT